MDRDRDIARDVSLAPLTTLKLGGCAEYFVRVETTEALFEALEWAQKTGVRVSILAGGSNVVVLDTGVRGLVIQIAIKGFSSADEGVVVLGAGEDWDTVVKRALANEFAGIECLSGIPGSVGATPIQNVGAYGQEIAQVLREVVVYDLESCELVTMQASECEFGYRTSIFKRRPGRWIVLEVRLELEVRGAPKISYPELMQGLPENPSLQQVRDRVLALRRSKSMLIDANDPDSQSAGSFFLNPVVHNSALQEIIGRVKERGVAADFQSVPAYPLGSEHTKLAAAWLIEKAGFSKGQRKGSIGISAKHALALVNYGGGSAEQLLSFADSIKTRVYEVFGVELQQEPRILGSP